MALFELTVIDQIRALLPDTERLAHDTFVDPASGQIFTTDMLVEHRHFSREYYSPADIGWKAAAVNLSDIAATGGEPRWMLIALGLPEDIALDFIPAFYTGMLDLLQRSNTAIVGGDTVAATDLTISVTAVGQLPAGARAGRRSGAKPGDWLIATGHHGLSAVGLWALQNAVPDYPQAKTRHRRPAPRLAEGQRLSTGFERFALIDSSDGLADAVLRLARSSDVRITLDSAQLPIHPEVRVFAAQTRASALDMALYGGEDFELVACIPATERGIPPGFQLIGQVDAGPAEALVGQGSDTRPLEDSRVYDHFAQRGSGL